jgi:hypothetical protein
LGVTGFYQIADDTVITSNISLLPLLEEAFGQHRDFVLRKA